MLYTADWVRLSAVFFALFPQNPQKRSRACLYDTPNVRQEALQSFFLTPPVVDDL